MIRNTLLLCLLCIIVFACKFKAEIKNSDGPDPINEKFIKTLKSKGSAVAMDDLFSHASEWIADSVVKDLRAKVVNLDSQVGKFVDGELLSKERMGKDVIMYSYLLKFERQPIRLYLMFYRAHEKWELLSFEYVDTVIEELKESAAGYRLHENIHEEEE